MTVWIGEGAEPTNELASRLGVTLNLWDADLDKVRAYGAAGPLTWAGPSREDLATWLDALEQVGVEWAVFAPDVDIEALANWRGAR